MLSHCCSRISVNIVLGYVASTDDPIFIHSYEVGYLVLIALLVFCFLL